MSIERGLTPQAAPNLAVVPDNGPINPDRRSAQILGGAADRLTGLADNLANRRTLSQTGGDIINNGVEAGRQLAGNIGEKVITARMRK